MFCWYDCITYHFSMAIVRFILSWFYSDNKLEENLKEWDSHFEKGKLKKGRRFR